MITEAERVSIEGYHRRHTKMRMRSRYEIEMDDAGYWELCALVGRGAVVHRSDASRPNQDVVLVDWHGVPVLLGWHRKLKVVTTALPPPKEADGTCLDCKSLRGDIKEMAARLVDATKSRAAKPSPVVDGILRQHGQQVAALNRKLEKRLAHIVKVEKERVAIRRLAIAKGATFEELDAAARPAPRPSDPEGT